MEVINTVEINSDLTLEIREETINENGGRGRRPREYSLHVIENGTERDEPLAVHRNSPGRERIEHIVEGIQMFHNEFVAESA